MDENNEQNLDTEYKRYLEIIRPYLGQLLDQDVIEICNAWIQRLSNCKEHEKFLRNKYIFAMCYQLAKGVLEEPFVRDPSTDDLSPLTDDGTSDEESFSELEYNIIDLENGITQVIHSNDKPSLSTTEYLSRDSDFKNDINKSELQAKSSKSVNSMTYNIHETTHKQHIICYNCSTDIPNFANNEIHYRAKNVVTKLREMKKQNFMLQSELNSLKEELKVRNNEIDNRSDKILKVNNATSTCSMSQDSTTTLKCKLQEVRESRNNLIEKISNLQDNLDNFNYIKKQEIDDLEAKYKLQIIEIKTSVREETKDLYEIKLKDLKHEHDESIKEMKTNYLNEIEKIVSNKDTLISEKDKIIISKDTEIDRLNSYIEQLKKQQCSMCNEYSKVLKEEPNFQNIRQKAEELQKRLNKLEKSKFKCSKAYETKLANLQKEKYLTECSFHLELVRQRAQVIHETSNEYQTELATALNKLETKYKEIIANVQSTAVQRRIQDQMAVESIIQAVCGVRNEGMYTNSAQATCPSQLTNKAARNQTRDCNGNCDNEIPTLFQGNKVGSIIVGNKSFGEESVINDYCLDSEKLGELFEKMYIPQRDTGCDSVKK